MTKKTVSIILASLLIFALITPAALAAITDEQQKAIDDIRFKMFEYRNQLIDLYVDAGLITKEEAALMKERNLEKLEWQKENNTYLRPGMGGGFGRGAKMGCCGGFGMKNGFNNFNNYF